MEPTIDAMGTEPEPRPPPLDRATCREADRLAMEVFGLPDVVLMENAGRQLADITLSVSGSCGASTVTVLVGRGNNGGDGLVAARHMHLRGMEVRTVLVCSGDAIPADSDAGRNLAALSPLPVEIVEALDAATLRSVLDRDPSSVLVDAVLGTGLSGEVRGYLREVLEVLAGGRRRIVAADLPSGLDADTGEALGPVPACLATATFLAPKRGLLRGLGPARAGDVHVCDIGVQWWAVVSGSRPSSPPAPS